MDVRPQLGRAGEDMAAGHLRRQGYEIVDRNFRCNEGELDVVARRDGLLIFCEVKTRRENRWGEPSEAVGWDKQRRIRRLAAHWMRLRTPGPVEVRFDVVSIVVRRGRAELTHIADAF